MNDDNLFLRKYKKCEISIELVIFFRSRFILLFSCIKIQSKIYYTEEKYNKNRAHTHTHT